MVKRKSISLRRRRSKTLKRTRKKGGRRRPYFRLPTKSKTLDDRLVPRFLRRAKIFQQTATPPNQFQQAAAGVVSLLVRLEVTGQIGDALSQQRDLNLWGTRVTFMSGVGCHQFGLAFSSHGHFRFSFLSLQQVTFGWHTKGCRSERCPWHIARCADHVKRFWPT